MDLIFKNFETEDKYSVPIMMKDREIINVLTQIGCLINCVFCPSSKKPFVRNLTSFEKQPYLSRVKKYLTEAEIKL